MITNILKLFPGYVASSVYFLVNPNKLSCLIVLH